MIKMSNYIFKQLRFVRENTLQHVIDVNEQESIFIPKGFRNHIKWNLGHIYVVHERFAFYINPEKMELPEHFIELFAPGTKPADWNESTVPAMKEIISFLDHQMDRIELNLTNRLVDSIEQPYTTSKGLTLSSVEEFLSFCLYHEGMHFEAIKSIRKIS